MFWCNPWCCTCTGLSPTFCNGKEARHVQHHLSHVSEPFTICAAMRDIHTAEHVAHLLTNKLTRRLCKPCISSTGICSIHYLPSSSQQEEGIHPGPLPPCVPGWLCSLLYHPLWNTSVQSGDWPDEYVTTGQVKPLTCYEQGSHIY